eukprot:CAMPEP_0175748694 /NCGR_PEP_ID=MMETSP0097-20121207/59758_1 /TAXON_ID=311494 /ORGANISM="Alexandrium monilatum, Strain CCMP3105" /LENGTH=101 /DNA_ID=CAMNT_0017057209 /DNA_START=28 /DNA_END=329 /DNA_ORIENTATION=-
MARIAGLGGFLERAGLASYLQEAEAFCRECGAVSVQEVLEDGDLCGELAERLHLKRLELRRFEAAAAQVRTEPDLLAAAVPEAPEEERGAREVRASPSPAA